MVSVDKSDPDCGLNLVPSHPLYGRPAWGQQIRSESKKEEGSGKSISNYIKAVGLAPDSADAYYSRGDAYDEMSEYGKAIADYSKAIKLNPKDSWAYYNRGLAHSKRGEAPQALNDLEKCIELSTDAELTEDALQVLREVKKSS